MTTRLTAGAFLVCGNKVLLMKRGLHKELGPGLWAGVGGHLDLEDIENPRAIDLIETCYREVQEETGISRANIFKLQLKYIAVRKDSNEIALLISLMPCMHLRSTSMSMLRVAFVSSLGHIWRDISAIITMLSMYLTYACHGCQFMPGVTLLYLPTLARQRTLHRLMLCEKNYVA